MKKLIICHPKHGHIEVTDEKDIKETFLDIMKNGYGNNIPALFMAEFQDGSTKAYPAKIASELLDDPGVLEVTVIAPMAGG